MIALIYVGGLYLTNISEEAKAIKDELKEFVTVRSTIDDTNQEQLKAMELEISNNDVMELFRVGTNFYRYKTMLGFRSGDSAYVFTRDDFKRFNTKMNLIPSDAEVPENSILISEKQANFMKIKESELLSSNQTDELEVYYGEYPFDVITYKSNAFHAYFITQDIANSNLYLLTWKEENKKEEFWKRIKELRNHYDKLEVKTYEEKMIQLKDSFEINNIIYYSIIVIVSIVFAITTNAVFVGLYDKRKHEFALYQGIGIPKKSIYKKVTFEILCMNGMGLALGAGVCMLVISLLNEWVYHQDGLSMWYYHPTAFLATLFCDLSIIIPGIGLRIRRISKEIKELTFL